MDNIQQTENGKSQQPKANGYMIAADIIIFIAFILYLIFGLQQTIDKIHPPGATVEEKRTHTSFSRIITAIILIVGFVSIFAFDIIYADATILGIIMSIPLSFSYFLQ